MTPIDTIARTVSHNIQRDLDAAITHHHECIKAGIKTDHYPLTQHVSDIYSRQMQPLHDELHRMATSDLPPRPKPVRYFVFGGLLIGTLAAIVLRCKVLAAIVLSLAISTTYMIGH